MHYNSYITIHTLQCSYADLLDTTAILQRHKPPAFRSSWKDSRHQNVLSTVHCTGLMNLQIQDGKYFKAINHLISRFHRDHLSRLAWVRLLSALKLPQIHWVLLVNRRVDLHWVFVGRLECPRLLPSASQFCPVKSYSVTARFPDRFETKSKSSSKLSKSLLLDGWTKSDATRV